MRGNVAREIIRERATRSSELKLERAERARRFESCECVATAFQRKEESETSQMATWSFVRIWCDWV